MRRALMVLIAVVLLLVGLTATSAIGQGKAGKRTSGHYGPAKAAVVKGSAAGRGAVHATLSRFAVAAHRSVGAKIAKVPFAYNLPTARGQAQKAEAASRSVRSTKTRVTVPTSTAAASAATPRFPGVGYTGFIPPDVAGAAGPYQFVMPLNGRISIFSKNGTQVSTSTPGSFFAGLGTPSTDFTFDPRAIWDEYINRFVILYTTRNDAASRSNLLVAVSQTSDALGGWNLYAFNARVNGGTDTSNWCDYPQLGYDSQTLYFTCNMFSTGGSPSFQYSKIRIMTTGQFTGGSCCLWWDKWDLREGFLNLSHVFSIEPVRSHGAINSDGGFLVAAEGGGGSGSNLHFYRVPSPQNCCVSGNQTDPGLMQQDLGVGSYSVPPAATQPSGVQAIDTGDTRLITAGSYWPYMFVSQDLADGSNATVDWTEVNFSSFPTLTKLNDWIIGSGGMNRYFGGADINTANVASMVYSASNTSTFAGTRWITIPSPTTCTSCFNGESILHSGANTYRNVDTSGVNRWGDYETASRDPNGTGVWIAGEYVSSQNFWGTEIGLTGQTLDTFAPTTTATRSPAPGGSGWNTSNVTVQLGASDTGVAGVRNITYSASGANPIGTTTVNGSSANPVISADGTTTVFFHATDNWGNVESTKSITVRKDATSPTFSGAPTLRFRKAKLSATVPVKVAWGTATDATSGFSHYTLWQSTDGGVYSQIASPTKNNQTVHVAPGHSYQFAVNAVDVAGNGSGFLFSGTHSVNIYQETDASVSYSGGWTHQTLSGASGGAVEFATALNKKATFTFSGAQVAFISTVDTDRGSCTVTADGGTAKTVNTNGGTLKKEQIVYFQNLGSGSHTLVVNVLHTAGHPRVDVDAFIVIT